MSNIFPSYIINENKEIVLLEEGIFLANFFSENGNFIKLNTFQNYSVTGELLYWCGINNIPAIDVELSNNENIDIKQNNQKGHWENFLECFEYLILN
jgi:hypothetical protein